MARYLPKHAWCTAAIHEGRFNNSFGNSEKKAPAATPLQSPRLKATWGRITPNRYPEPQVAHPEKTGSTAVANGR